MELEYFLDELHDHPLDVNDLHDDAITGKKPSQKEPRKIIAADIKDLLEKANVSNVTAQFFYDKAGGPNPTYGHDGSPICRFIGQEEALKAIWIAYSEADDLEAAERNQGLHWPSVITTMKPMKHEIYVEVKV